jgi:hypothetical protein
MSHGLSPDCPPNHPQPHRKFQFRLSYLLYLLTVFAVASAVVRGVLAYHSNWSMTPLESWCLIIILTFMLAYFTIRVPLLFRRWRRGAANVADRKRELAKLAAELREKRQ